MEHHGDAGVVLVDVRQLPPSQSDQAFPVIGEARSLPILGRLWDRNGRGMREVDSFAASIRGLTLDPKSEIVIYGENGRDAGSAYFVFRLLGYEKVRVFEGGWSAWKELK